jgi:hypothetical protein
MTEKEKLIKVFDLLESQKSRDDVLFVATSMLRAQDALKADYGLDTKEPPKPAA